MKYGFFIWLLPVVLWSGCDVNAYCLNCDSELLPDGASHTLDGSSLFPDGGSPFGDGGSSSCVPNDDEELCNEVDDDCDGKTDEGFDLMNDLSHCGTCDTICRGENATFRCETGACVFNGCQEGFVDNDDNPNDCEYRCPVSPPASGEVCNGLDDDCDGRIDEPEQLSAAPANLCRRTANTPCATVQAICTTREGVTGWFCDYASDVEFDSRIPNGIVLEETKCDGKDGDCDGIVDDSFSGLGSVCSDTGLGVCQDIGRVACDPSDNTRTFCDLSYPPDALPSSSETCNNLDDDCDGTVDNLGSDAQARQLNGMVRITRNGLDFWIFRYEASRPDSTSGSSGAETRLACSKPGVVPWITVGYDIAAQACASAGGRLCTAQEWQTACEGASPQTYPYGNSYQDQVCNGADRNTGSPSVPHRLEVTGSFSMCTDGGAAPIFDMSGNLKEWTNDPQGTVNGLPIYVVRGGSYESPRLGLTCQTTLSRATSDTTLPTLGFRCCADP